MGTKLSATTKVSDINPFGVRMPADLKTRLDREASIRRRSLNSEIVSRLEASFGPARSEPPGVAENRANYEVARDDHERAMLSVFRHLGPEKQLALLSLFK